VADEVSRVLLLVLVVAAAGVSAQSLPALTAPVNDFAHVISPDAAATLDRRIRALQSATGDAVVVATVQSFAPYGSIDEYAVRLFEQAKIGEKNKDNGVLVVLALEERRVRIEVGYGLEAFVTDGFSGETIRQVMLPEFRQGAYGNGLLAGTTRIIGRIAQARGVTLPDVAPVAAPQSASRPIPIGTIIFIIILIALFLSRRRRGPPGFTRRMGRGPWSGWSGGVGGFGGGLGGFGGFGGGGFGGGGGGGGFGGFGGGRSGGGGASGGW
jgi:uncharacterized protein